MDRSIKFVVCILACALVGAGPSTRKLDLLKAKVVECEFAVVRASQTLEAAKASAQQGVAATAGYKSLSAECASRQTDLDHARKTGSATDRLAASSAFNKAQNKLKDTEANYLKADHAVADATVALAQANAELTTAKMELAGVHTITRYALAGEAPEIVKRWYSHVEDYHEWAVQAAANQMHGQDTAQSINRRLTSLNDQLASNRKRTPRQVIREYNALGGAIYGADPDEVAEISKERHNIDARIKELKQSIEAARKSDASVNGATQSELQRIKDDHTIVDYGPLTREKGTFGRINREKILQIIDKTNCLIEIPVTDGDEMIVWLKNWDTTDRIDGDRPDIGVVTVTGTTTYETVIGQKTVLEVEALPKLDSYLKVIYEDQ